MPVMEIYTARLDKTGDFFDFIPLGEIFPFALAQRIGLPTGLRDSGSTLCFII
jgi:hypothetical protein